MPNPKHFEFESHELVSRNPKGEEVCALIRVAYDLASDPAEILEITDVDTGREYKLLELPPNDGWYIILRLRELLMERIPDPHAGVDEAYEAGLDRKRLN